MAAGAITSLAFPRPFSSLLHPDCNKYHYAEASLLPRCCLHLEKVRWCKPRDRRLRLPFLPLLWCLWPSSGAVCFHGDWFTLVLPFHSFSSQTSVVPSLPPSGPRLIMTPPTHSWDPQPFLDFLWPQQSVCQDSFYVSLSRQKHRNTPAVSLPIAFSMILNQGCTLSRKWWPKPHFWLLCFDWSFVNSPNFSHICARSYTKLDLRHKAIHVPDRFSLFLRQDWKRIWTYSPESSIHILM